MNLEIKVKGKLEDEFLSELINDNKDLIDATIKATKEQLLLNGVVHMLPTKEELCDKIKNNLAEINKDKPIPSNKHDLGYSNGFVDCYEFMTK